MSTLIPIGHIDVGERDREDLGDIDGLAASIAAVGLLHPLPITGEWKLVGGERRLAAVTSLGWTEVPVTVVDLTTVAEVLRAEADENTCRKALTPAEAERARARRAVVLAEDAKRRQGERHDLQPSPNLGGSAGGEDKRTAKAAAAGTGYSGSTLDKVQEIREVAEEGVIRRGNQLDPIPAPDEVREAAQEAYAQIRRGGTPVDPLHRKVAAAIAEHVEVGDPAVRQARRLKAWHDALSGARAFREFDMTSLPELLDDMRWDHAAPLIEQTAAQVEAFREARPSALRIARGGVA